MLLLILVYLAIGTIIALNDATVTGWNLPSAVAIVKAPIDALKRAAAE